MAEATGLGVAVSPFRSRDHVADLERIFGQLGPHLRMASVAPDGLTPAFTARVKALDLHLVISGWETGLDSALIDQGDPTLWLIFLNGGFSAITDQPDALLSVLGR